MQFMHEHLSRAHSSSVSTEAERTARTRRYIAAARAQRRAEASVARARRLLLLAVSG